MVARSLEVRGIRAALETATAVAAFVALGTALGVLFAIVAEMILR